MVFQIPKKTGASIISARIFNYTIQVGYNGKKLWGSVNQVTLIDFFRLLFREKAALELENGRNTAQNANEIRPPILFCFLAHILKIMQFRRSYRR